MCQLFQLCKIEAIVNRKRREVMVLIKKTCIPNYMDHSKDIVNKTQPSAII